MKLTHHVSARRLRSSQHPSVHEKATLGLHPLIDLGGDKGDVVRPVIEIRECLLVLTLSFFFTTRSGGRRRKRKGTNYPSIRKHDDRSVVWVLDRNSNIAMGSKILLQC